jgi:hypothetical protein
VQTWTKSNEGDLAQAVKTTDQKDSTQAARTARTLAARMPLSLL